MNILMRGRMRKPDTWLSLVVFALVFWGLISVYSASIVVSLDKFGNPYHYLINQAIALTIGVSAWFFVQYVDYHRLKKLTPWLLGLSLILLILVLLPIPSIAPVIGGAKRWLFFGPINFQASELVKLFFVIYISAWLSTKNKNINSFFDGLLPYWLLFCLIAGLILLEPDLGTALVFLGMGLVLFFVAGAKWIHVISIMVIGIIVVLILSVVSPYRFARLTTFLNPANDPEGIGYHARNISIAVGSGGLFGQGFGNSKQKYFYLPEAHTDSIYAVVSEELGFLRSFPIIFFFGFLIWRGIIIARKAPDEFGRYLALGISAWFGFQVIVNLGGMLGVLPLTGVPLPFFSSGGTSLVISLIAMGILLNISRQRRVE
ncbi:MAG: putative lipid II flippase FtsW [Patescibacteria group bacterium]|nr:putative lipid II flippase FtsW [Patescibacteria group bacterium]